MDKVINIANPQMQYTAYQDKIDNAIKKVLLSGSYILGENC